MDGDDVDACARLVLRVAFTNRDLIAGISSISIVNYACAGGTELIGNIAAKAAAHNDENEAERIKTDERPLLGFLARY